MWLLEEKIDYDPTTKGKVYARELNLVNKSGNRIMVSTGDSRPGDDNEDALLGAIDDISKMQLFQITNNVLGRMRPINGKDGDDVFEAKQDMLIHLFADSANPLTDTVSINGSPYTLTVGGLPASQTVASTGMILLGKIDVLGSEIVLFSTGGKFDISETITHPATGDWDITLDKDKILALVHKNDGGVLGGFRKINLNGGNVNGRVIIFENDPTAADTGSRFTELHTIPDMEGIGSSLLLDRFSFRIKLIMENGKFKVEKEI